MTEVSFDITFTVTARIRLDTKVIEQVDDNWRKVFYDLRTPNEIVEMIAYNMLQGRSLSRMDGFADLPDGYVYWGIEPEYEFEDIEKVD